MEVSSWIDTLLKVAGGAVGVKGFEMAFMKKKINAETISITESQNIANQKFCLDQLELLEKRHIELQTRNDMQAEKIKQHEILVRELRIEKDELKKDLLKERAKITNLKVKLAAWEK